MFRASCLSLLGADLIARIEGGDSDELSGLRAEERQALLQAFVPKKIAHMVRAHGWLVKTVRNVRYGGGDHAPMVTWAFSFDWDLRATSTPTLIYREALVGIFENPGHIAADGSLERRPAE